MDAKYEFVSGTKLYDTCKIQQNITIRYYQICQYDKNNMYHIRSLLFEGNNQKNCIYEFVIKENKSLFLTKKEINKFIKFLNNVKKEKFNKIKYKSYPTNDVSNIEYPNSNDLMILISDLMN